MTATTAYPAKLWIDKKGDVCVEDFASPPKINTVKKSVSGGQEVHVTIYLDQASIKNPSGSIHGAPDRNATLSDLRALLELFKDNTRFEVKATCIG